MRRTCNKVVVKLRTDTSNAVKMREVHKMYCWVMQRKAEVECRCLTRRKYVLYLGQSPDVPGL